MAAFNYVCMKFISVSIPTRMLRRPDLVNKIANALAYLERNERVNDIQDNGG